MPLIDAEVVCAAASAAHEDGARLFLGWRVNLLDLHGVLSGLPVRWLSVRWCP